MPAVLGSCHVTASWSVTRSLQDKTLGRAFYSISACWACSPSIRGKGGPEVCTRCFWCQRLPIWVASAALHQLGEKSLTAVHRTPAQTITACPLSAAPHHQFGAWEMTWAKQLFPITCLSHMPTPLPAGSGRLQENRILFPNPRADWFCFCLLRKTLNK